MHLFSGIRAYNPSETGVAATFSKLETVKALYPPKRRATCGTTKIIAKNRINTQTENVQKTTGRVPCSFPVLATITAALMLVAPFAPELARSAQSRHRFGTRDWFGLMLRPLDITFQVGCQDQVPILIAVHHSHTRHNVLQMLDLVPLVCTACRKRTSGNQTGSGE